MNKQLKKLAGQTVIYGFSSVLGRLLNYLLVPLYTRLFLPEVYGIITELYAYVTFLLILLTYGMETGLFRFGNDKQNFNKVYSSILFSLSVTSSLFIIIVLVFLEPIASAMQYSEHPEYILWMALIVALDAFTSIPFARLRLENKAWKFAIIKLINICTNIGFNLFFLIYCPKLLNSNPDSFILNIYSPNIGVGYVFISNLLANIITLIILLPEIFNVKIKVDFKLLKTILKYSLPLLVAGFAGMINETLDRVMLKHLVPEELNPMAQLGIYGANYKLAVLMTLFIQMFRYAAEPFFFQNKNESNARQLYAKATKYFIIFGLMIFLGVMFYIDIIKYFISPNYHEGLKVVPILLIANLFLGIFFNFSIWYKLNDMTKYGAWLAIFGAVITIVLNLVLVPIYGYVGAAWATLVCYFLMTLLSFYWGQKYYKVPYEVGNGVFYFVLALSLYFVSVFLKPESQTLMYVLNTILLLVFVAIFVVKEKFWREFVKVK
ncbi:MAG: Polysaccharide biosynthesis protein [Bacteroidetes bacterium ADurb.Bin028]|nr:MAG: Polysaccharide biosynthesis protein [Bacteroidetes bacterium ADurb.Bin028]